MEAKGKFTVSGLVTKVGNLTQKGGRFVDVACGNTTVPVYYTKDDQSKLPEVFKPVALVLAGDGGFIRFAG